MSNTTPAIHLTVDDTFQNAREVGASNAVSRMLIEGLADLKVEGNYRRFTVHDLYDLAVELQERLHRIKV